MPIERMMIMSKLKKMYMETAYYKLPYPRTKKQISLYNLRTWMEFDIHKYVCDDEFGDGDPITADEWPEYNFEPWRVSKEYLNLNVPYSILAVPENKYEWDLFRYRYRFEYFISNHQSDEVAERIFKAYSKLGEKTFRADVNRICIERKVELKYRYEDIMSIKKKVKRPIKYPTNIAIVTDGAVVIVFPIDAVKKFVYDKDSRTAKILVIDKAYDKWGKDGAMLYYDPSDKLDESPFKLLYNQNDITAIYLEDKTHEYPIHVVWDEIELECGCYYLNRLENTAILDNGDLLIAFSDVLEYDEVDKRFDELVKKMNDELKE